MLQSLLEGCNCLKSLKQVSLESNAFIDYMPNFNHFEWMVSFINSDIILTPFLQSSTFFDYGE